jgi:hypothetical protein
MDWGLSFDFSSLFQSLPYPPYPDFKRGATIGLGLPWNISSPLTMQQSWGRIVPNSWCARNFCTALESPNFWVRLEDRIEERSHDIPQIDTPHLVLSIYFHRLRPHNGYLIMIHIQGFKDRYDPCRISWTLCNVGLPHDRFFPTMLRVKWWQWYHWDFK